MIFCMSVANTKRTINLLSSQRHIVKLMIQWSRYLVFRYLATHGLYTVPAFFSPVFFVFYMKLWMIFQINIFPNYSWVPFFRLFDMHAIIRDISGEGYVTLVTLHVVGAASLFCFYCTWRIRR